MVEAELKLFLDWSKYQHTEEHGNEGGGGQQLVQHPEVDGLDLVLQLPVLVVNEPFQHGLFRLQVPVKSEGLAVAEVDQGREGFDAVSRNEQKLKISRVSYLQTVWPGEDLSASPSECRTCHTRHRCSPTQR